MVRLGKGLPACIRANNRGEKGKTSRVAHELIKAGAEKKVKPQGA